MSVPWGRPEAACMGSERRDCPLADPASVSRRGPLVITRPISGEAESLLSFTTFKP